MGSIAETAEKRFIEGYSCAQAVFSAFAEAEGIELETALKLASSFGAGGLVYSRASDRKIPAAQTTPARTRRRMLSGGGGGAFGLAPLLTALRNFDSTHRE